MADQIKHNNNNDDIRLSPGTFVPESKGYALSGRIMLSAIIILFAVVVIMICLHIYARWYILRARHRQIRHARRRTHLVFYIEPDNPSNIVPLTSRGLDASVLKSLPVLTFSDVESDAKVEAPECAVCLSEFEGTEKCRLLPKCNHCFHLDCIDMWFHSHDTCPLCRAPVDSGDVVQPPAEEVVVELGELTQNQPTTELTQEMDPALSQDEESSSRASLAARKGLDLGVSTIEVPRRSQSFCFSGSNFDESGPSRSPGNGNGFKSPTSRIMSLKRILSREKKSPLPSPSPSGVGSSCGELDIESGRVDTPSQGLTPR